MAATDPSRSQTIERARRVAAALEALSKVPPPPTTAAPPSSPSVTELYDLLVTDPSLRQATRKLFMDGHHAESVRHGCMHINNHVKRRSGVAAKDGNDLMNHVFGLPNPVLRINAGKTVSDRDEQDGYRLIFGGVMCGLRNPRAHEPIEDDAQAALEMLVLANHLMRVLSRARKVRRRVA